MQGLRLNFLAIVQVVRYFFYANPLAAEAKQKNQAR